MAWIWLRCKAEQKDESVKCEEARALLQQGVQPGPGHVGLGFHLAGCLPCRGFRAQQDGSAQVLLDDLLAQPLPFHPNAADVAALTALLEQLPPLKPSPRSSGAVVRPLLIGFASGLLLLAALPAARAGLALYTIRQNVHAMIVTPQPVIAYARPTPSRILLPITRTATDSRDGRQEWLAACRDDLSACWPGVSTAMQTLAVAPGMRDSWAREAPTVPLAPTPAPLPTPVPGDPVTVVFLGSDLRLDESGPSRADSVLIARIDPARPRVALLSLTRDLMVDIPGYGYARINAANAYGGPDLVRQSVSNLLGMPVDYYAYVDFAGFIHAVDALGGITINVDKEIYEPGWGLHFVPGPMTMDGLTALRYSRTRMSDSDYDRVRRQQEVLLGIAQKVRELQTLESLDRMAVLSGELRGAVQTDIPEEQLVRLAWALRNYPLESVERYSVDGSMVSTFVIPGDPYAQVIDPATVAQLRAELLGSE